MLVVTWYVAAIRDQLLFARRSVYIASNKTRDATKHVLYNTEAWLGKLRASPVCVKLDFIHTSKGPKGEYLHTTSASPAK